ncbi:MAG: hypothetical protein AB7I59_07670 [Geminicoccaceae bacterium]
MAHPSGDPSCYTPPFSLLVSPCVPHDVPAGSNATVAQLAFFAWQEFIALNWVAMDPASTGVRGRPATGTDPNSGFFGITPDSSGNYPLVVWQTYRHKNELFPAGGNKATSFDSNTPTYKYAGTPPTAATGGPVPSFQLFNNLDETSQIGLANMYAHAPSEIEPPSTVKTDPPSTPPVPPGAASGTRVAYEAKVNRAVFDYIISPQQGFTNSATLQNALTNTQPFSNNGQFAGICTLPAGTPTNSVVMLPCGDINVPGDPGEGAIEIKAAWRALTADESKSGRFFTRNVIFYTGPQGKQVYHNAVWGLVALHIIHKTKSFPAFVFATWEQVDNYDDDDPSNPNPQTLAFQNLPLKDDATTSIVNIPVRRAHPIHSQVASTNDSVHAAFKAADPDTLWQYYKLVGVQATPVSGPPPAGTPLDDLSYYYLANIMVETNQTLQNFFGSVGDDGHPTPLEQVYVQGAAGSPFAMGGCQGCHGFQGQIAGGDMSVLIANGTANAQQAESIDSSPVASVRTVIHRDRHAPIEDGHSLREFEASRVPKMKGQ